MKGAPQRAAPQTHPSPQASAEPDELAFLEHVARHPEETVTTTCAALDLSGSRAARIRQGLAERGLVVEVETRLGRLGRRAKYAVPTLEGYHAVGVKPPKGRGGPLHKHFAEVIGRWAKEKDYHVSTEHQMPGGWVDLHLERDGQTTAVQLAVNSTVDREINNLRKCLEAGYSKVVTLFLDRSLLQSFQEVITKKLLDEEQKKIEAGGISRRLEWALFYAQEAFYSFSGL